MELVYTALLLNCVGKDINEANVKKVIEAAGKKADEGRVKALVSSLKDVDINEAIKQAAVAAPAAAAPAAEGAAEEKKDEKKSEEDEKKKQEEAASGLSSLFG